MYTQRGTHIQRRNPHPQHLLVLHDCRDAQAGVFIKPHADVIIRDREGQASQLQNSGTLCICWDPAPRGRGASSTGVGASSSSSPSVAVIVTPASAVASGRHAAVHDLRYDAPVVVLCVYVCACVCVCVCDVMGT
jgi:hypothetical protein